MAHTQEEHEIIMASNAKRPKDVKALWIGQYIALVDESGKMLATVVIGNGKGVIGKVRAKAESLNLKVTNIHGDLLML
jgi:hypothetical protein